MNFTANRQFSNSIIHDFFYKTVWNSLTWRPVNAWKPPEGYPHVMFMMEHGFQGDDKLLRGEVLAIVAAMITRLQMPSLESHKIVPVSTTLLFSSRVKSNEYMLFSSGHGILFHG